jgi:ferrous iron transport protein B
MTTTASRQLVVALAGNPNSGKTTLFNALTGARQHVGNYPGVTVEKKEGHREYGDHDIRFVDLPGTYSLSAYSLEELVARDFVIEERPDVVVDVVDASNLERNLYLASMFVELDVPVILALNMMDVAEARGKQLDLELLGQLFGARVVPIVASKGTGMDELLEAILEAAAQGKPRQVHINFGGEIESHLTEVTGAVQAAGLLTGLPARWVAIKLLENDEQITRRVRDAGPAGAPVLEVAAAARRHLEDLTGDDAEVLVAERRYGFAHGAARETVTTLTESRIDWSEKADALLTNRVLGLPIFFAFMWLMFEAVFRLGQAPMTWLEALFAWLQGLGRHWLPPGEIQSMVVDGIIGGVGGVLVFVPNIMLLFLAISLLEDSGYMARAAFVVDRVMHQVGLHGKSFISMLLGFGCSVPAIMATRMLESRRDRIITILVVPLMSCGARLPVYILLAGAFFSPAAAGQVIFSIYLLGVLLALAMAKIFRHFLLPGPPEPFVMELPPYRMPTLKGTLIHMGERGWMYVQKAGTTILAMSVLMWFLLSYPHLPPDPAQAPAVNAARAIEHSYAGRAGKALEPVITPLGFDYRLGIALFSGLAAKEIVVSTLGTVFSLGEDTGHGSGKLRRALAGDPRFSPLTAYALMVFVLIYIPCLATLATVYRETCSWRWALFAGGYTTLLAWVVTFVVYQGGRLLGLG